MKKFVALFVMFCALQGNAQTNCLRTTTSIEGSSFKQFGFSEKIYWRRRLNGENKPKTVYNFCSIYKLDSIWGIGLYGLDIDLMSEQFEKRGENKFRYWNKIRMGFSFMFEKNPRNPPLPAEGICDYINGEIYLNYLHLPHKVRGDRNIKFRRGSFMLFFSATPSKRFEGYLKCKPFGRAWIKPYFKQEYSIKHIGICAEVELNPKGYNKTKTESSKDLYRGFTIFGGPDYNLNNKTYSFSIGIKYDGRNH